MSQLTLALLGTPEVRHDGQVLTFRTRKALALLIYLSIAGGMHSREKLTNLFWPEGDEEQGRMILRSTLARLRSALEGAANHDHLLIKRDTIGFDFTSEFDLDLRTLDAAFALAQKPAHNQVLTDELRQNMLARFQDAARIYRGSFLEGFSLADAPAFDEWATLEREVYHRRMGRVFERLSHLQFSGGELATAIETTMRWVRHDPFHEYAHRQLMQVYLAAGERESGLRAYENLRSLLAAEWRTRPAPETEDVARRLRTQLLPRRESARIIQKPLLPTLPETPLIGRATEHEQLVEYYWRAQSGQTQIVLLTGEAGIGKTRLAKAFLGWAGAHGASLLTGRAFEMGSGLAYHPLVEALRPALEQVNAPDDLLSDTWLAELSRLLPELRDRYPDLTAPTGDDTTARGRLFEAVVRLFQAFAQLAPLVFFIDDLQWADQASLDLLHYAGQHWLERGVPLLLLLCMRSEALVTPSPLTRWLAGLERDLHVSRLAPDSLTLGQVMQLLAALGKREGKRAEHDLEGFGRWLFTETGGQPFSLVETLKALLERDLLALRQSADGRWEVDFTPLVGKEALLQGLLPSGVREMIRARLSQLAPTAFSMVVAGAILEHGFSFEQLCSVADLPVDEALTALDEVLRSRLLQEATPEAGSAQAEAYAFPHEKIRDVVYTEAGETRRRLFHRRALDVLQASGSPSARLAHHALASRQPDLAFQFSVAAGDEALRLFAAGNAIAHFDTARRLLAQPEVLQGLSGSALQHLFLQLGRAYELTSDFAQANALYEEMLDSARELGEPVMESVALSHLATVAIQSRFDVETAVTLLYQALQVAEQGGNRNLVAEMEWSLAQQLMYRCDPVAALPHGEHALLLARQSGEPELIARSLNTVAYSKNMLVSYQEASMYAQEARTLYAVQGNRAMEADCLCQLALSRICAGHPRAGIAAAQEAQAISLAIENAWGQVNSAMHLAHGWLEVGNWTQALAEAEQGLALAREHGIVLLLSGCLDTIGTVQRAMLALDAACTAHREALSLFEPRSIPVIVEMELSELCADCVLAGAWDEAATHALRLLEMRSDVFPLFWKLTLWCETEALVRAGETERATADVERYGERVGTNLRHRIPYLRALAVLARSRGECSPAIRHLHEAGELASAIGLPGEQWPIYAALADLYLESGEAEQARSAARQAASLAQDLADNILDEEQRAHFLASPLVQCLTERSSC